MRASTIKEKKFFYSEQDYFVTLISNHIYFLESKILNYSYKYSFKYYNKYNKYNQTYVPVPKYFAKCLAKCYFDLYNIEKNKFKIIRDEIGDKLKKNLNLTEQELQNNLYNVLSALKLEINLLEYNLYEYGEREYYYIDIDRSKGEQLRLKKKDLIMEYPHKYSDINNKLGFLREKNFIIRNQRDFTYYNIYIKRGEGNRLILNSYKECLKSIDSLDSRKSLKYINYSEYKNNLKYKKDLKNLEYLEYIRNR